MRRAIATSATGDSQHRIGSVVVIGAFYCDLPISKDDRPETFPHAVMRISNGARTLTIVHTNLLLVRGIIDGIMEGENIAQRIRTGLSIVSIANGNRDGMLNHMDSESVAGAGTSVSMGRKHIAIHDKQRN